MVSSSWVFRSITDFQAYYPDTKYNERHLNQIVDIYADPFKEQLILIHNIINSKPPFPVIGFKLNHILTNKKLQAWYKSIKHNVYHIRPSDIQYNHHTQFLEIGTLYEHMFIPKTIITVHTDKLWGSSYYYPTTTTHYPIFDKPRNRLCWIMQSSTLPDITSLPTSNTNLTYRPPIAT